MAIDVGRTRHILFFRCVSLQLFFLIHQVVVAIATWMWWAKSFVVFLVIVIGYDLPNNTILVRFDA